MEEGLKIAKSLLVQILEKGLPTATEFLDPITPQYLDTVICLASIGARTVESQTHREMASGLSMPVGFKNSTAGSIDVAIHAMVSSLHPHDFLGIDDDGRSAIVHTTGNKMGHLVLRGGDNGTNYHRQIIEKALVQLRKKKLPECIVVDCSHANSGKQYQRRQDVLAEVAVDRREGLDVRGVMLESNLEPGRQDIPKDPKNLQHGVSVTDGCIGWKETEYLLQRLHDEFV